MAPLHGSSRFVCTFLVSLLLAGLVGPLDAAAQPLSVRATDGIDTGTQYLGPEAHVQVSWTQTGEPGVTTPGAALGLPLVERLDAAQVKFTASEG